MAQLSNSTIPLLHLKNISKSFGNNILHDGISIKLFKGETLGLLGKSGSGKSILLKSMIGLNKIDKGIISYNDKRIDNLAEDQLIQIRIKMAYAFQNGALFDSLTVYENLAYPLKEHTQLKSNEINFKIQQVLDLVELGNIKQLMPSDLSGGMKKRVGLARAIIMTPEIVLYDEPTAGLDPQNSRNILKIIKKLKSNGQTSIFVTHDIPAAIEVCDRIIVLHCGNIIFNDCPDKLLASRSAIIKDFIQAEGYAND